MSVIVIDIETVPGKPDWIKPDIAENLHPPGNIKKQESIDKWFAGKGPAAAEEQYAKCSLDAATGEIIVIGYQVNDEKPKVYDYKHGSEGAIISQFFGLLEAVYIDSKAHPALIGHNLIGFDLPYIWRRAVVNGICPPAWFTPPAELKAWDDNIFDTMIQWAGVRDKISLDKLCKVFGIPGKNGITGADVYPMYLRGELDAISEYCMDDVAMTYDVYKRLSI